MRCITLLLALLIVLWCTTKCFTINMERKNIDFFRSFAEPNVMYQECTLPDGKAGHCRDIQYCVKDEIKDNLVNFTKNQCIIEQRRIGICCADETESLEERREKRVRDENIGCGLSTGPHGRVTGGQPANHVEWAWMAAVTLEDFRQYCGGALITDQHVLTAAHCTRRWKASDLRVRLGKYDLERGNDSRSYNFQVVEIRQHVDFEPSNYHNDIAILKLHRLEVLLPHVWPICLPPVGLQLTNKSAIIIGWGTTSLGGPYSDVLMEVSVPIWDQQRCIQAHINSVFEENICAGVYEGGKDACQGDSGGPLMYKLPSRRWTVIGIVSWGVSCGEPNHPGIYTRVDKYLSWIVENILS